MKWDKMKYELYKPNAVVISKNKHMAVFFYVLPYETVSISFTNKYALYFLSSIKRGV